MGEHEVDHGGQPTPAGVGRRRFLGLAAAGGVAALVGCQPPPGPVKTYSFSVAGKGALRTDLGGFAAHALQTLNSYPGWSLGGSLGFRQVASGGDFTLWLCEARLVPTFSSVCSATYSCRVGRNVIINQDRWLGATSTWPYGLDEYRHYVVNHETGHWLGMGHWSSPGRGNLCPVMFQQSKGIRDGSIYNTWPTPAEKSWVSTHHGVPVRFSDAPASYAPQVAGPVAVDE